MTTHDKKEADPLPFLLVFAPTWLSALADLAWGHYIVLWSTPLVGFCMGAAIGIVFRNKEEESQ